METATTHDKVKALRASKNSKNSELDLKKVTFGGYDCKEVEEYISMLKSNMQLSETVFNEKLEEYYSTSEMYLKERDKLLQIISDTEKKAIQYKSEALEKEEQNKNYIVQTEKENQELKELVKSLNEKIDYNEQAIILKEEIKQIKNENQELQKIVLELQNQIDNDIQNQKLVEEFENIKNENKDLYENIYELSQSKNQLFSENSILNTEIQKELNIIQKLNAENDAYKKKINSLKSVNRNNILKTNMKVFEYKQSQQLSLDNISVNANELISIINSMKIDLYNLIENTKIENEE